MTQQINLFEARFRPRTPHFSARTMGFAVLAVALLTLAFRGLYAWQTRSLETNLAQTDKRAAELREQAVRFAREFGDTGRGGALADEIARVEEQLRARRGLLEAIHGGAAGGTAGFSPYLSALARQAMQGVWLTGIQIGGSGELVLKGRVLQSELVPAYIERLKREPLFNGREVRELRLAARDEAGKRYIEFLLQIPLMKGAS
jgi:hypothetical protein